MRKLSNDKSNFRCRSPLLFLDLVMKESTWVNFTLLTLLDEELATRYNRVLTRNNILEAPFHGVVFGVLDQRHPQMLSFISVRSVEISTN